MIDDLPPTLREIFSKLVREFEEVDDEALIILKGHLIAEEMLNLLLASLVRSPEALAQLNLRFPQRVWLVQALFPPASDLHRNGWQLVLKLNELRNALAHSLDRVKRKGKLEPFFDLYLRLEPSANIVAKWPTSTPTERRGFAVGHCLGFLGRLADDVGQAPQEAT